MSNVTQSAIDQAVCWAIWGARRQGGDLSVGEVVKDLTIPHTVAGTAAAVGTHVSEATVEQRHLDAISAFHAGYGMGVEPWTVTFQIAPAA